MIGVVEFSAVVQFLSLQAETEEYPGSSSSFSLKRMDFQYFLLQTIKGWGRWASV